MKKGFFQRLLNGLAISVFVFLIQSPMLYSSELLSLQFQQKEEESQIIMEFDRTDVISKRFHVHDDKQIIVDLKGVETTERVARAFDTSEFSGSVVFVSTYKKPKTVNDLRIAVQLRDNVRSYLERREKKIILHIENRFGVFSQNKVENNMSYEEKINTGIVGELRIPKSDSIEDILENITLSGRKKYIGKKISLNVKDVSVQDILSMIADASGFNIITTPDIKTLPALTINLTNIPWDQALDTILDLNNLVASKNGVILLVTTLENATKEKEKEANARKVALKEERLVTNVFPISYATTTELKKILDEYLTPKRGKISEDKRTNSLIVKDTPEVIEKIRKIIEVLDTQTPQVLIESKIVEVTETYAKEIGLVNGLSFGYDPIGSIGSGEASTVGGELADGADGGPGFKFSSAPTGAADRSLFGLSVKRFNRLINLDFTLNLMESESKGKIVASPKVITQNKKKAKINTVDTTSFAETNTGTATSTTTFKEASAELLLEVTPQVTNEGSIALDIEISKEQFGARPQPEAPPDKQLRKINTSVLVDNGSTIVIGGIYNFEKRENHSGIPFLKDIPLLGWLFRTLHNPTTRKNELIIFLTPRVINQEEAGLGDKT